MTPLLETRGLSKTFGGLKAVQNVDLRVDAEPDRQRHRPQRRGQDDFLQLPQRDLSSRRRRHSCSMAATSPDARRIRSASSGMSRTFQNIRLFPGNVGAGKCARRAVPASLDFAAAAAVALETLLRPGKAEPRRSARLSGIRRAGATMPTPSPATSPTACNAASKSPARWRPSPAAAARRTGRRA